MTGDVDVPLEALRVIIIVSGLLLLGLNAALFYHARKFTRAVSAWRLFFAGKSAMTTYLVSMLWHNLHRPVMWTVWVALTAIVLTLIALWQLDIAYVRATNEDDED